MTTVSVGVMRAVALLLRIFVDNRMPRFQSDEYVKVSRGNHRHTAACVRDECHSREEHTKSETFKRAYTSDRRLRARQLYLPRLSTSVTGNEQ